MEEAFLPSFTSRHRATSLMSCPETDRPVIVSVGSSHPENGTDRRIGGALPLTGRLSQRVCRQQWCLPFSSHGAIVPTKESRPSSFPAPSRHTYLRTYLVS